MSIERPLHILLVDDETSVLFALRLLLEAMNYAVTDFSNAAQALEALEQGTLQVDLFLCDLKMPQMNGFEALKRTRQIDPDLLFILMSAHASTQDIEFAKNQGASAFLAKPFTPAQLKAVIEETSRSSTRSHEPGEKPGPENAGRIGR